MILGIDVGSIMVSVAEVGRDGTVGTIHYEPHHGQVRALLGRILAGIPSHAVESVACTTATPAFVRSPHRYNDTVCTVRSARELHPEARAVITVGGERFSLVRFGEDGTYRSARGNTSCAAGTGSFLDQQARRLGLSGSAELSRRALGNQKPRPTIASRCSVFAKTDLIHAQQEGYGLDEICDGLCYGLARNLVDTLASGEPVGDPLVFAGGVSRNRQVVTYVSQLLSREVIVDEYGPCYGAIGACLEHLTREREEGNGEPETTVTLEELIADEARPRDYHFPPLELVDDYPEFDRFERFESPSDSSDDNPVEVDIYVPLSGEVRCLLGIDIGSTSTKAVIMSPDRRVFAAFYTRTAGRPLAACREIFRAVRDVEARYHASFEITACGTTGSGRKFAGRVFGADLVLDEITAHAQAAYQLDPAVDTIIEIGGQDAKFTTMRNGRVTFSQMNSVCAAGTGSFIEEQAAKLDVPLSEYAERAFGASSPLASDRCTVFMERDINYYLNREYATSEILAAALHSVRENYLQKVAVGGTIGERICFQGATAKNPALVASFKQKLGRPIYVSKFCHVTGAMGVALVLAEEHSGPTRFRGLDLYSQDIPVRIERCELCANHCRLRIAEVNGETVAFGFLCGRDYATQHYVPPKEVGFDLERFRQRIFSGGAPRSPRSGAAARSAGARPRLGLPNALHLTADLPFWRTFFGELGIPVVEEEPSMEALALGKEIQQAEFCAPMAHMHGQVVSLLEKAEYVFLPMYIGLSDKTAYCYYTQFTAPVLKSTVGAENEDALVTPALGPVGPSHRLQTGQHGAPRDTVAELTRCLEPLAPGLTHSAVRAAYAAAEQRVAEARSELRAEYDRRRVPPEDDITVVLTGRPYTVLDPVMNKGIPRLIASQGVNAFFHDMLPSWEGREYDGLLAETAWRYAQDILETARTCALTDGLYPVLITSFKCSPDSFIIDFFTHIMEEHDKPFLVLQVDEHDSGVGYETRVEAGIRAFRNHHRETRRSEQEQSSEHVATTQASSGAGTHADEGKLATDIGNRTLLLPTFDPITAPLLAANLRRHGVDARILAETPEVIRRSMRLNTGQCVPINVIAQETLEALQNHDLAPEHVALWMPRSGWPCNIAMYPHLLKRWFEREGAGELAVFAGDFSYVDISPQATMGAYFAYLFGGLLRRIGCMMRPYELLPGATDRAIDRAVSLLEDAFLGLARREERLDAALGLFDDIPTAEGSRPKVALFGDLYVRDNEVFNQDLIRTIEEAGGEVVTTPYSDYTKIIAGAHFKRLLRDGKYADWALYRTLLSVIEFLERRYYDRFERWVGPRISSRDDNLEENLETFGLHLDHAGESLDNVLKVFRLLEEHPDLALLVQASPAFCCPSLVTEAMGDKITRVTGVPVVSVAYDGTGAPRNDMIVPYLRFAATSRVG